MTHQIIKTDNYLLVVDDSEIKDSDWTYNPMKGLVFISSLGLMISVNSFTKKIIAHLPLNGVPVLEGVDLLPPYSRCQENDIELLIPFPEYHCRDGREIKTWMDGWEEGHKEGYQVAREKYNLTLNKLIDMYIEKTGYGMDMWSKEENETMSTIADIIESLQQPKLPITFECEMEEKNNYHDSDEYEYEEEYVPKTTTINGHIVWVGKYIY